MTTQGLWTYTIYHNPTDYPGRFVVRRAMITPGGIVPEHPPWIVCDSLEEARRSLPPGKARVPRDDADAPSIVETWV